MAEDILKKKVTLGDLLKSASAEPSPNTQVSPVAPTVLAKPVKKTTQPAQQKSIVPSAVSPVQVTQPVEQPAPSEQSFISNLFKSAPTEPGEYSTARNVGTRALQFIGNFGNSLAGNAALNPALNQAFAQQRQEYHDKDPNSRSSVLYRGMAKTMGLPIRGDETAYTLKEQMPNVKEFLMARQMQMKGGGGPAQVKNKDQAVKDINEHIAAVRDLASMRGNLQKLDRNPLGSFLPDTSSDTIATAAEIQKQVQSGVKAIAGPGSIQESERSAFMPLLPNANERSGTALAKQNAAMKSAIGKGKSYIKDQLNLGNINEDTARYLMGEYARYEAEAERGGK